MDGANIQDSSCENKHFQVSCNEKNHGFRKMYFAALAALSFATAMGMACGYSASATADMGLKNSRVHPSKEEIAWIGSILALGALTGGLFAGKLFKLILLVALLHIFNVMVHISLINNQ